MKFWSFNQTIDVFIFAIIFCYYITYFALVHILVCPFLSFFWIIYANLSCPKFSQFIAHSNLEIKYFCKN